jgi:hypothetical protein
MLETEGIVIDGKRVNMKKYAWSGPKARAKSKKSARSPQASRRTTRDKRKR